MIGDVDGDVTESVVGDADGGVGGSEVVGVVTWSVVVSDTNSDTVGSEVVGVTVRSGVVSDTDVLSNAGQHRHFSHARVTLLPRCSVSFGCGQRH